MGQVSGEFGLQGAKVFGETILVPLRFNDGWHRHCFLSSFRWVSFFALILGQFRDFDDLSCGWEGTLVFLGPYF